ncbi:MAG: LPP20 family lipoprotein, partial [Treponema sp.]|nr:LPP20 family lipoprotein [Treponema sp.]
MAQIIPPWLSEMAPDGVLWGIGIAKQSSDSFSQIMAQSRARQSISYQLNSCIQAAITDYNRDAGTTGHIINTTLQESITRIVTSSQLNGSRITKTWRAPDGTFWC